MDEADRFVVLAPHAGDLKAVHIGYSLVVEIVVLGSDEERRGHACEVLQRGDERNQDGVVLENGGAEVESDRVLDHQFREHPAFAVFGVRGVVGRGAGGGVERDLKR